MTEFFCSVETVNRMFLGFPCTVKTDRSLLSKLMMGTDDEEGTLRFG